MSGYSVIFLLCIKHGKPVPVSVLVLCYDFWKVWQQRGAASNWVRYYNVQCGISFPLEICNFMDVEKMLRKFNVQNTRNQFSSLRRKKKNKKQKDTFGL